ncbi:peptide-methionine (S)-S-oxide reductase MsrA [Candidatus Venteria ishoeyi]|uniref:Peptide methionine sulfoxide reductase MsrA n=1 Tax=Candidatus Venteria ishoeyi TaxID=1899563 RepID=A0A1H6F916_9GAMM|nr:peptide-methionine (S)-S-oxide reductase MsrA [Candidatus Venteria ishoeyi]SEH06608.1 Peptide methionine sulfoxide reductase MsrA [Candidatus Venteria ishoeyi]
MHAFQKSLTLPQPEQALPGRSAVMPVPSQHFVLGHTLLPPFPELMERAVFGLGCFWGAEKLFWQLPGVYSTAVGYSAGYTANPTYDEVCTGKTGHNEVVLVIYHPRQVTYSDLLTHFWESHDPTQGMRQGNDTGTQYRSAIYTHSEMQLMQAQESLQRYQQALNAAHFNAITTEVCPAKDFYYAEEYHQQYLAKNPQGYCGLGGIGLAFPAE